METYNRNNTSRGGDGWFCYCDADYICFVQENYKIGHIVSREELIKCCWRNWYRQKTSEFSCGYIVPIEKLKYYRTYHCIDLR